jgi:hypothetical protein
MAAAQLLGAWSGVLGSPVITDLTHALADCPFIVESWEAGPGPR